MGLGDGADRAAVQIFYFLFLFICLSTFFKRTWPDMQIVPSSFSFHPILNFYGSSDDIQLFLFFPTDCLSLSTRQDVHIMSDLVDLLFIN